MFRARARMALGVKPLAERWSERGAPIHRMYLEQYVQENASDIRGRCLEFQGDTYTSRFGGSNVTRVDILHKEQDNPKATIVADLTEPNEIPADAFDCIICTYTLHIVTEPATVIREMHRILKPDGVLMVAVPDITIWHPEFPELWRFTRAGLHRLLAQSFGEERVSVSSYGNSLVAAGELRGLVARDFTRAELAYHDPRYSLIVCGRAVKG